MTPQELAAERARVLAARKDGMMSSSDTGMLTNNEFYGQDQLVGASPADPRSGMFGPRTVQQHQLTGQLASGEDYVSGPGVHQAIANQNAPPPMLAPPPVAPVQPVAPAPVQPVAPPQPIDYQPVGRDPETGNWRPTQHDGPYDGAYALDYATTRLNDTHGIGNNEVKLNELSQFFTDVRTVRRRDPEAFEAWVGQNPEEAIRFFAMSSLPRWDGAATPEQLKENGEIAQQLAYFYSQELGYGEDGVEDGKAIAADFNTFNDVNNEGGPGDIWKLGRPSALPGGFNDFIEDNPAQIATAAALAFVAPQLTSALVSSGMTAAQAAAVVAGGSSAVNAAMSGASFEELATAGLVGAGTGFLAGGGLDGVLTPEGGLSFGDIPVDAIPPEVAKGPDLMDSAISAAKGVADVIREGEWGERGTPTIGNTPVGSRDGWHWEVNDEGEWRAVPDSPEAGGGAPSGGSGAPSGGGSPASAPAPDENRPANTTGQGRETEIWRHQNPDGTWVAGDETGDVWEVDGPAEVADGDVPIILPPFDIDGDGGLNGDYDLSDGTLPGDGELGGGDAGGPGVGTGGGDPGIDRGAVPGTGTGTGPGEGPGEGSGEGPDTSVSDELVATTIGKEDETVKLLRMLRPPGRPAMRTFNYMYPTTGGMMR